MPQRIFLTGASGFVGQALLTELLGRGHHVLTLIHRSPISIEHPNLQTVQGDLFDASFLARHLHGCDAIIHLLGIIRQNPSRGITFSRLHEEATRILANAAVETGVFRLIHMSALGSAPHAASIYHRTKYSAEQIIRRLPLRWTIFRPSLIHGPKGEFMQQAARWARKTAPPYLFMPYFGAGLSGQRGAGRLQPVYVNDVARAFADALENDRTIGEIYPLAGPDILTWPQMHRLISCAVVGHRRWIFPIPAWFAILLTRLVPAPLLPFNRDQVQMSQEDNTALIDKFIAHFGWMTSPFEPTLRSYASQL